MSNFERRDSLERKFHAKLGFASDAPKGIDVLNRLDYNSDGEFLNACAEYDMKQTNPQYAEARRQAQMEYERRMNEAHEKEFNERLHRDAESVVLYDTEIKAAAEKARNQAENELGRGKVTPSQMGHRIDELYQNEISRIKMSKAISKAFTAEIKCQELTVPVE